MKVSLRGLHVRQWSQAGFSQLHASLLFKLGSFQDTGKGKKINCPKKSIEVRQETTSPSCTSIKTATKKGLSVQRGSFELCVSKLKAFRRHGSPAPDRVSEIKSLVFIFNTNHLFDTVFELLCKF